MPVSTLQRPKQMGESEMTDIEVKCKTLLLHRMYLQDKGRERRQQHGYRRGTSLADMLTVPQ